MHAVTLALILLILWVVPLPSGAPELAANRPGASVLDANLLVTWYGNPHSARMGILGEQSGMARSEGLRRQAAAYVSLTAKTVLAAYHLVAVIAQSAPGADRKCRRRESYDVMRAMLEEARAEGFKLVLDVQPGRSPIADELAYLRPLLAEPDVYLALDPEYDMCEGETPGQHIGSMPAADINEALDLLERVVRERALSPKVLILHQFRLDMLPDKERIRKSAVVDVVLNMDGFGSQSLKLSSYRAVIRQYALPFAGIKLFYRQDTGLFTPAQVMQLRPVPSVVIYQ